MSDCERWMMLWRALGGERARIAADVVIKEALVNILGAWSLCSTGIKSRNVPLLFTGRLHGDFFLITADTGFRVPTDCAVQCWKDEQGWHIANFDALRPLNPDGQCCVGHPESINELAQVIIEYMQIHARSKVDEAIKAERPQEP